LSSIPPDEPELDEFELDEPELDDPERARTHATDTLILFAIAAAVALLHLLTNSRYGFHRDELQFLSDARHLDWGFVSYPPWSVFVSPPFSLSARSSSSPAL
jgi:hypothetical protein